MSAIQTVAAWSLGVHRHTAADIYTPLICISTKTVIVPAGLFNSAAVLPGTAYPFYSIVRKPKTCLLFCRDSPSLTLSGTTSSLIFLTSASLYYHQPQHVLRDTMPTRVHGHFTKALLDTVSNHSVTTLSFLQCHDLCCHKQAYTTTGISSAAAPCLGPVLARSFKIPG